MTKQRSDKRLLTYILFWTALLTVLMFAINVSRLAAYAKSVYVRENCVCYNMRGTVDGGK